MPSISCVLPCAVNACAMSLQSRQEKFTVDTKSKYNVFVCVELTVEFAVDSTTDDQIKAAHYKLASPQMQVQSYVQDIVRTWVPRSLIRDVLSRTNELHAAIVQGLVSPMGDFGFTVQHVVVNISPYATWQQSNTQSEAPQSQVMIVDASGGDPTVQERGEVVQAEAPVATVQGVVLGVVVLA
eukprot:1344927-Prymnesium_polylepis.1